MAVMELCGLAVYNKLLWRVELKTNRLLTEDKVLNALAVMPGKCPVMLDLKMVEFGGGVLIEHCRDYGIRLFALVEYYGMGNDVISHTLRLQAQPSSRQHKRRMDLTYKPDAQHEPDHTSYGNPLQVCYARPYGRCSRVLFRFPQ